MSDAMVQEVLAEMKHLGCYRAIVAVSGRSPRGDKRTVFGFARQAEGTWPIVDSYLGRISAKGIDTDNFDVQCLLEPYVDKSREPIESADIPVSHIVVTSSGVRAYPESVVTSHVVGVVDVPFPEGVYKKLIKLSRGPRTLRPKVSAYGSAVEPMLDKLDDILFSGDDTGPVYMNAIDYATVRKFHGGSGTERLDPCVKAKDLKRGLQGDLRGSTASTDPRKRTLYATRAIPVGYVYVPDAELSMEQLPPHATLDSTRLINLSAAGVPPEG